MSVQNGTEAKDIIMHFLARTNAKDVHGHIVARYTESAKKLLSSYSKQQVLSVINHLTVSKKFYIYSFGYIVKMMDDTIMELDAIRAKEEARITVQQMASSLEKEREEAIFDDDSTERNRSKASRFGVQSRLREKYSFDLLEGQS